MTTTISDENRSYGRGKVKKVMFNDRCGYALVYYDPIYDHDSKIDALNLKDLPYTIPLNTKSLKKLKPAGKPSTLPDYTEIKRVNKPGDYETAKQFMERKLIESKMDEIREACYNCKRYFQKAEKFDLKRREIISPRLKAKIRGRNSDEIADFLVDDVMHNVDYVYDRNIEPKPKKIVKTKKIQQNEEKKCEEKSKNVDKLAAKVPKKLQKIQVKTPDLKSVSEDEDNSNSNGNCDNCKCSKKSPPKSLESTLKIKPHKYEELSLNTLRRQRQDLATQRAFDELLFEINYGRVLRKLKSEIRRLKEDYS